MDTIEARDIIKRMCKGDPTPIQLEALDIAYDILSIGLNPEQIMELEERDTVEAPIDADEDYGFFTCPSCGEAIYASDDFTSHKFCLNCGQRIKWED